MLINKRHDIGIDFAMLHEKYLIEVSRSYGYCNKLDFPLSHIINGRFSKAVHSQRN